MWLFFAKKIHDKRKQNEEIYDKEKVLNQENQRFSGPNEESSSSNVQQVEHKKTKVFFGKKEAEWKRKHFGNFFISLLHPGLFWLLFPNLCPSPLMP